MIHRANAPKSVRNQLSEPMAAFLTETVLNITVCVWIGVCVSIPTYPSNPSNPTDPTDPTDPTYLTDPTNPTNLLNPQGRGCK
jgi:hypothetical protein